MLISASRFLLLSSVVKIILIFVTLILHPAALVMLCQEQTVTSSTLEVTFLLIGWPLQTEGLNRRRLRAFCLRLPIVCYYRIWSNGHVHVTACSTVKVRVYNKNIKGPLWTADWTDLFMYLQNALKCKRSKGMPLLSLIFSAIHNIGLKISHADFVHSGL